MSELKKCQYCTKSYIDDNGHICCSLSHYDKVKNDWRNCAEAIKLMVSVEKGDAE